MRIGKNISEFEEYSEKTNAKNAEFRQSDFKSLV